MASEEEFEITIDN